MSHYSFKLIASTSAALAGFAAAECNGSPCTSLMSVSQVGRLPEEDPEVLHDPVLATNTFTAVDQCATSEVKDLTSWVLNYYQDVSDQLDSSFSNILTTARLANSALKYLGGLSLELNALQRVSNISQEMNAMLRTCLADAMHLSASMERCDLSFSQETAGMEAYAQEGTANADSVWIEPISNGAKGTCLASLCEHHLAWNYTCGEQGFLKDLERIAAAHDLEGSRYNFHANPGSQFLGPPTRLYGQSDEPQVVAQIAEDLMTQETFLLNYVSMWLQVQFNGMMVMVRKAMSGGQMITQSDHDVCSGMGIRLSKVEWLSVVFSKCSGSMVKKWIRVNAVSAKFMHALVEKLDQSNKGLIQDGMLFGGPLTNMCDHYNDIEDDIVQHMEELKKEYQQTHNLQGDKTVDTFYLNNVQKVGDYQQDGKPFNDNTGPTESVWISSNMLTPPTL